MPYQKIEQIADGAYFVFEPSNFSGSILAYDPLIANQTIMPDCCALSRPLREDRSRSTPDQQHPPPSLE
jgi:hypothetical protein